MLGFVVKGQEVKIQLINGLQNSRPTKIKSESLKTGPIWPTLAKNDSSDNLTL